jgi:hypothetical protein
VSPAPSPPRPAPPPGAELQGLRHLRLAELWRAAEGADVARRDGYGQLADVPHGQLLVLEGLGFRSLWGMWGWSDQAGQWRSSEPRCA